MAREGGGTDPQLRANAQSLLNTVAQIEEQMARYKDSRSETDGGGSSSNSGNTGGGQPPALRRRGEPGGRTPQQEGIMGGKYERTGYIFPLRKPEAGEEQVLGLLVRVDCDAKGVTFIVKVGERTLKLRTNDLNDIHFTTFTPDVSGEMTCGARNPANNVVITFRPAKAPNAKSDGDPIAVEFVPKDFELKKQ
jgi:hypothetical protein